MNNEDEKMNNEDEVKKLKSDMFLVKVILTFVTLTLGVLIVGGTAISKQCELGV